MKPKVVKRQEALERLRRSLWENSKAKRKGTKTKEEWETYKEELMEKLS